MEHCEKALELDGENKAALQLRATLEKAIAKEKVKGRQEKREAKGVDWLGSRTQKACKEPRSSKDGVLSGDPASRTGIA